MIDPRVGRLPRLAVRWWRDLRGAAAVQFIAVLPVFIVVVVGIWAFYSVYSARDALCDATQEAQKYLQVEGPRFPDDMMYPDDWEVEARKIVESELKSHQWYDLVPVDQGDVDIWPDSERHAPEDMSEVSEEAVGNAWFFVRVTKTITHPLGFLLPAAEGEGPKDTMVLSCQTMGFYEDDPLEPTPGPGGQQPRCPPVQPCTPGPPAPTNTPCDPGDPTCPTPDPCPPCD